MTRSGIHVYAVFVVALVAACSESRPSSTDLGVPGKADDPGTTVAEVAAILRSDGAVLMPPTGLEWNANELTVEVRVVPADEGALQAAFEPLVHASANQFLDDEGAASTGLFGLLDDADTHFFVASGFEETSVKDYLRDSLLSPWASGALEELLSNHAHYASFRFYNAASEIRGYETILIRPWRADQAIVLSITYVHA